MVGKTAFSACPRDRFDTRSIPQDQACVCLPGACASGAGVQYRIPAPSCAVGSHSCAQAVTGGSTQRFVCVLLAIVLLLLAVLADARPLHAQATVPTAPQDFAAVPSHQRLDVSWTAPASNGGADILRYEFRIARGDSVPEDTAWEDMGLRTSTYMIFYTNHVPHALEVRAVNEHGAGPAALLQALLPVSTAYGQNSETDRVVTETTEEHPAVTVRLELEDYRFREGAADTAVAIVAEVEAGADRPQSEFGVFVYSIQVTNSATSGGDYEDVRTSLVFAPGDFSQVNGVWQGRKTVTLPVLDDHVAEGEEFLEMSLAPSNDFPEWASLVEPDSTTALRFARLLRDGDDRGQRPRSLRAAESGGGGGQRRGDADVGCAGRCRQLRGRALSLPLRRGLLGARRSALELRHGEPYGDDPQPGQRRRACVRSTGAKRRRSGRYRFGERDSVHRTRYVSIQAQEATVTEGSPARFRFHRPGVRRTHCSSTST